MLFRRSRFSLCFNGMVRVREIKVFRTMCVVKGSLHLFKILWNPDREGTCFGGRLPLSTEEPFDTCPHKREERTIRVDTRYREVGTMRLYIRTTDSRDSRTTLVSIPDPTSVHILDDTSSRFGLEWTFGLYVESCGVVEGVSGSGNIYPFT